MKSIFQAFKAFTILFFSLFIPCILQGQIINFDYISGNDVQYALEDVRKITYTETELNLHLNNGSIYTWELNHLNFYNYTQPTAVWDQLLEMANEPEIVVFPNPTRGDLNFRYTLKVDTAVRIEWFDMSGNLLSIVFDENQPAGEHVLQWRADGFSVGTYFCRIQTSGFSISKPVVLTN